MISIRFFTRLISATVLLVVYLQSNAQISGQIIDDQGQGLPFAHILLLNPTDSVLISGVLTDELGRFETGKIKKGTYLLSARLVGYEDGYSDLLQINQSNQPMRFPEWVLLENMLELESVEVEAQRMSVDQTEEGLVMNVQSSLMTKGSTALQIVERAPGVVLDQQNANFTLNGQSGTLVMINGKAIRMSPDQLINMLSGMSADNIEKVELLTNPGAKYDADGGAGIINIVMNKREDQGTNGSLSITGGYGWGQKEIVSLNANHRKGPLNYFGSYSFSNDESFSDWQAIGGAEAEILEGAFDFDFTNNSQRTTTSHNFVGGLEREWKNGWLSGINLLFNTSNLQSDILNEAEYVFESTGFLGSDINIEGNGHWNSLNPSLFTEKQFKSGEWTVDMDYLIYRNDAPTQVASDYYDETGTETQPENDLYTTSNRGSSLTDINLGVLKTDYRTDLTANISLETGLKYSFSNTENTASIDLLQDGEWLVDDRHTNALTIDENIGAGYASVQVKVDSLTSFTVGSRYEFWDRAFNDPSLDRSFGQFFPSFFLSHQLSASTHLHIAYSRRITRPDYNDLASFLTYNGPTSVFSGNPLLQPSISQNTRLGFQVKGYSFSLSYLHEDKPLARFQLVENEAGDLVLITPQNLDYQKSWTLQANLPFQLNEWWSANIGGSFVHRDYRLIHTEMPVRNDYYTFNFYGSQNFQLPASFSIEVSGWYTNAHYNGSVELKGFGMLNVGLKKDLKEGSIQFTVTDVLRSMSIVSYIGNLTEEAFRSTSWVKYQPESTNARIFKLSYIKNFGSQKVKGRKERHSGAKEEKSRLNQ